MHDLPTSQSPDAPTGQHAPECTAVDQLAQVRDQIASLRDTEAALMDEIRTLATERGASRISGVAMDAVIETRTCRRLDAAKLSAELLVDPDVYTTHEETVVLMWPRPLEVPARATQTHPLQAHTPVSAPQTVAHSPAPLVEPRSVFVPQRQQSSPNADAPEIAERVAPADLRPTREVDLQPMARLPEEDRAADLSAGEAPLDPLSELDHPSSPEIARALEEARAMEQLADEIVEGADQDATLKTPAPNRDQTENDWGEGYQVDAQVVSTFTSRRERA